MKGRYPMSNHFRDTINHTDQNRSHERSKTLHPQQLYLGGVDHSRVQYPLGSAEQLLQHLQYLAAIEGNPYVEQPPENQHLSNQSQGFMDNYGNPLEQNVNDSSVMPLSQEDLVKSLANNLVDIPGITTSEIPHQNIPQSFDTTTQIDYTYPQNFNANTVIDSSANYNSNELVQQDTSNFMSTLNYESSMNSLMDSQFISMPQYYDQQAIVDTSNQIQQYMPEMINTIAEDTDQGVRTKMQTLVNNTRDELFDCLLDNARRASANGSKNNQIIRPECSRLLYYRNNAEFIDDASRTNFFNKNNYPINEHIPEKDAIDGLINLINALLTSRSGTSKYLLKAHIDSKLQKL